MVNDAAILASMPGLAEFNRNPCNSCKNNYECLKSPWVPPRLMKAWKDQWQGQAQHITDLGEQPGPLAQVKFLKTVRPAKLGSFIKKNCNDGGGNCP